MKSTCDSERTNSNKEPNTFKIFFFGMSTWNKSKSVITMNYPCSLGLYFLLWQDNHRKTSLHCKMLISNNQCKVTEWLIRNGVLQWIHYWQFPYQYIQFFILQLANSSTQLLSWKHMEWAKDFAWSSSSTWGFGSYKK